MKKNVVSLVDASSFKDHYKQRIDEFCQALIDQFNKDEDKNVFPSDESELIKLKLIQIKPEIERFAKAFSEKTKYGFNKIVRYTPDDIALFGYKKFGEILNTRLAELQGSTKSDTELKNLSNPSLAMFFFFIGKNITPTNLADLSNIVGRKLNHRTYRDFLTYEHLSNRVNTSLKNHIAIKAALEHYIEVLPILENNYPDKFSVALNEFQTLKGKYEKQLKKLFPDSKY